MRGAISEEVTVALLLGTCKENNAMRPIETTATVSEDGVLTVDEPVAVPPGRHRVIVVVDNQDAPATKRSAHEWPEGYVEQTFGALADDPLMCEPQGDYEERESLN